MRIRLIFPILIPLLGLLIVFACGDDDDGDRTPTPSPSAAASATATEQPSPTAEQSPTATLPIVATPARTIPPNADVLAVSVLDFVNFLNREIPGQVPTPVPCPYEPLDGVIDCSAEGQGRIALDVIPSGANEWQCRALLKPDPDSSLFAASCTSTDGQKFFPYSIED